MKVGDFVVERLHAWGVRRIYGYPGDGINGVTGALQRADKIERLLSFARASEALRRQQPTRRREADQGKGAG